MNRELW